MKRLSRVILPAFFILTAAASGLRAQQTFPSYGTVSLPEISTTTGMYMRLASVLLTVNLADDSTKILAFSRPTSAKWRDGVWKDLRDRPLVQLLLPTFQLQEKPELKVQYKLDYEITQLRGNSQATSKITEYLPADKAASFSAKADFPLQPVIIDGSGLAFAGTKPGLAGVQWTVNRQLGTVASRDQGVLKAKTALQDGTATNKTGAVTANISFVCAGGRKIEWANNGKDLRKLAPDLVLKLTQPDCQ
jgi:hypothetical protein